MAVQTARSQKRKGMWHGEVTKIKNVPETSPSQFAPTVACCVRFLLFQFFSVLPSIFHFMERVRLLFAYPKRIVLFHNYILFYTAIILCICNQIRSISV